jgi:hypothetical protein
VVTDLRCVAVWDEDGYRPGGNRVALACLAAGEWLQGATRAAPGLEVGRFRVRNAAEPAAGWGRRPVSNSADRGQKVPGRLRAGADGRSRTGDLRITNALLYQLSYVGSGTPWALRGARR